MLINVQMLFLRISILFSIFFQFFTCIRVSDQSKTPQLLQKISLIDSQIQKLKKKESPQYRFIKVGHSTIEGTDSQVQALSSSSIVENDKNSYPMVLRIGSQIYSLRGQKIFTPENNFSELYHSSSRNEHLFLAHESSKNLFMIRKLSFNSKNPIFQIEDTIQIPLAYGSVLDFENSFSLSQQLYAFTTDKNYLIFLNRKGQVHTQFLLPVREQNKYLKIQRLNNNLLVYSSRQMFVISNTAKNSTLRTCELPSGMRNFQVKFDDNNWRNFYVKDNQQVYVFNYDEKKCAPSRWFQLPKNSFNFHIASNMLILQSTKNHNHFYYNLTNGILSSFQVPQSSCDMQVKWRRLTVIPRTFGSHLLCDACSAEGKNVVEYSCYILEASSQQNESELDTNDYSKFRIPIVFVSLSIVIYLSVSKKKTEGSQQEKYQKLLSREDEKLKKMINSGEKGEKKHDC